MEEKKTLEQVLAELKEAEKEYKEKCIKYGIVEKQKRKKNTEGQEEQETQEGQEQEDNTNNEENEGTISEN